LDVHGSCGKVLAIEGDPLISKAGYVPDRYRCLEGRLMLISMDAVAVAVTVTVGVGVGVPVRDLLVDL
jgi:hypothetical protein